MRVIRPREDAELCKPLNISLSLYQHKKKKSQYWVFPQFIQSSLILEVTLDSELHLMEWKKRFRVSTSRSVLWRPSPHAHNYYGPCVWAFVTVNAPACVPAAVTCSFTLLYFTEVRAVAPTEGIVKRSYLLAFLEYGKPLCPGKCMLPTCFFL